MPFFNKKSIEDDTRRNWLSNMEHLPENSQVIILDEADLLIDLSLSLTLIGRLSSAIDKGTKIIFVTSLPRKIFSECELTLKLNNKIIQMHNPDFDFFPFS